MKASEVMAKLERLIREHGDRECVIDVAYGTIEDSDRVPVQDVCFDDSVDAAGGGFFFSEH